MFKNTKKASHLRKEIAEMRDELDNRYGVRAIIERQDVLKKGQDTGTEEIRKRKMNQKNLEHDDDGSESAKKVIEQEEVEGANKAIEPLYRTDNG